MPILALLVGVALIIVGLHKASKAAVQQWSLDPAEGSTQRFEPLGQRGSPTSNLDRSVQRIHDYNVKIFLWRLCAFIGLCCAVYGIWGTLQMFHLI